MANAFQLTKERENEGPCQISTIFQKFLKVGFLFGKKMDDLVSEMQHTMQWFAPNFLLACSQFPKKRYLTLVVHWEYVPKVKS